MGQDHARTAFAHLISCIRQKKGWGRSSLTLSFWPPCCPAGIRSIPTVMIFKGGKKMDTIIGAVPKATLVQTIEKYL